MIVVTDLRNLDEAVKSSGLVQDPWLIPHIAVIKEALEQQTVNVIRRVTSEEMLSNCLTKSGANGLKLLDVLRTGEYELPGGWP